MRLVLTAAFVLTSGSAFSSSITSLSGTPAALPSIVSHQCPDCPAPRPKVDRSGYKVPSLAEGTQSTVIREIAGEKKLFRTEAWLGGSPVVFVSKAAEWPDYDGALAGAAPQGATEPTPTITGHHPDGIDLTATTGALTNSPETESAASAAPDAVAMGDFNLRLQPAQ
jgi:hypothetical protein